MKNRSIFLELTSLLDVILIIMFLVLVQSEGRVNLAYEESKEEFATEIESLQQEINENLSEKEKLSSELESLKMGLEEDAYFILLNLQISEKDRSIRTISIEPHEKSTEQIDIVWEKDPRKNAFEMLDNSLSTIISESDSEIIFIVFKFNSKTIYEDDYRMIKLAIQRQKQYNSNIYTAELDLKERN